MMAPTCLPSIRFRIPATRGVLGDSFSEYPLRRLMFSRWPRLDNGGVVMAWCVSGGGGCTCVSSRVVVVVVVEVGYV